MIKAEILNLLIREGINWAIHNFAHTARRLDMNTKTGIRAGQDEEGFPEVEDP